MTKQALKTNQPVGSSASQLRLPPVRQPKMTGPAPAQIGDIWYRVEGSHIGDEMYQGVELEWSSWQCVKTTARGAWFLCLERHWKKQRFALTSGARTISRTKHEALEQLIARKVRHLQILHSETVVAEDTLEAARAALAQSKEAGWPAPVSLQ